MQRPLFSLASTCTMDMTGGEVGIIQEVIMSRLQHIQILVTVLLTAIIIVSALQIFFKYSTTSP